MIVAESSFTLCLSQNDQYSLSKWRAPHHNVILLLWTPHFVAIWRYEVMWYTRTLDKLVNNTNYFIIWAADIKHTIESITSSNKNMYYYRPDILINMSTSILIIYFKHQIKTMRIYHTSTRINVYKILKSIIK